MSDDDPSCRDLWCHLGQAAGDIFIGQAVESVTTHTLHIKVLRDRVVIDDRAVAAVERNVEAGDLREARRAGENRTYRREVVGLVERRQRHIAFEIGQHLAVDQERARGCASRAATLRRS
jgi:hypothetical protein